MLLTHVVVSAWPARGASGAAAAAAVGTLTAAAAAAVGTLTAATRSGRCPIGTAAAELAARADLQTSRA